jgi:hypothetical protein
MPSMDAHVITLGSITIRQREEQSYENYTVSKKKSVGKLFPFHVTDAKIDIMVGYAVFINGERDIRALEVQKEYNTFGRLTHGLRLAIQPMPGDRDLLYAELRQALPKDPFSKHETLHPTTSEADLDQGARLSVFDELRKVGGEVGTKQALLGEMGKRSPYLCIRFAKNNLWAPVVAYTTTRIMPILWGFTGVWSE